MLSSLHPKWYATFLENWPEALHDLAPERIAIDIPPDVLDWMIAHTGHLSHLGSPGAPPIDDGFRADLEKALAVIDGPSFVRTGVCSFKRPTAPLEPLDDIDALIALISAKNHNVAAILRDCRDLNYPLAMYVSAWRDIPAWSEFRIFIKDLRPVGASQYHHQQTFPEIGTHYDAIASCMSAFLETLLPVLHLPDVAVDLSIRQNDAGQFESSLIEINPFISRTDACLFSWQGAGDFDGRLRYR